MPAKKYRTILPDMSSPNNNSDAPELTVDPKSVIEKMARQYEERENEKAKLIENEKEWASAAKSLFGSRNGKLFIKYLIRHIKLFQVDTTRDMTKMLEDRGAKNVYLRLIRPYLPPELLAELETQG